MFQVIIPVITLGLLIFALIDVITSDESQIKHLPKLVWVLLIVFLPLVGSIIWLITGKDRGTTPDHGSFGDPRRYTDRQPSAPVLSDEERIENEIAYHERQAEIRRLEAEVRRRRENRTSE